eukprot:1752430-Rhodomonas_salina.2
MGFVAICDLDSDAIAMQHADVERGVLGLDAQALCKAAWGSDSDGLQHTSLVGLSLSLSLSRARARALSLSCSLSGFSIRKTTRRGSGGYRHCALVAPYQVAPYPPQHSTVAQYQTCTA